MVLDERNKILTGDVLLFSGNTTTAFLIKFFSSSDYNHMGIAIRLNKKKKIVKKGGKLYVLEINAHERYDVIQGKYVKGIALTDYDDLIKNYNDICVRHIDRRYINKNFCVKARKFINTHTHIKYSSTLGPIVGVWLGCPITGIERGENEMFCTEMAAYFYSDVCGCLPTIDKPPILYKPDDFTASYSPLFVGKEYSVYKDYSDASVTLIIPLIVGVFFTVFISMLFPRKKYI